MKLNSLSHNPSQFHNSAKRLTIEKQLLSGDIYSRFGESRSRTLAISMIINTLLRATNKPSSEIHVLLCVTEYASVGHFISWMVMKVHYKNATLGWNQVTSEEMPLDQATHPNQFQRPSQQRRHPQHSTASKQRRRLDKGKRLLDPPDKHHKWQSCHLKSRSRGQILPLMKYNFKGNRHRLRLQVLLSTWSIK